MKPDNTPLLDSPFPTVIGCDRYQYGQIEISHFTGHTDETVAKNSHL